MRIEKNCLTELQIVRMIAEWDDKSCDGWVEDFRVHRNTIITMAKEINAVDPNLCPKKT